MLDQKNPIRDGMELASLSSDPRVIYLAPRCCYTEGEGRLWCEDKVWPCTDCPDPAQARVAKYILSEQIPGQSGDPT